jgi:voltage-gated sodium channel
LTFFFIGSNSIYIGIDAEYNATIGKPDNLYKCPIGFIIMENVFCVYFTGEVLIRLIAYRKKRMCFTDAWFVFDSILVTFMVLEVWILPVFGIAGELSQFSVLRLLRLLRISRMARLMKKVPELMMIIKGLLASVRSVGCTAILQVLILYVFSILFVSEYHEEGYESKKHHEFEDDGDIDIFFGSMGKSMFSLFIYGTVLDDVTYCSDAIRATDNGVPFYLGLFLVFIVISSFTILNMLIGILCEVVTATAESEKTKSAETSVKDAITTLFNTMDVDGSGTITETEFNSMRDDAAVKSALEEMDIYDSHFARYCELLFHKDDEKEGSPLKEKPTISFEELINMILRLSPGNHINALDFSLLQASVDRTQETLRERVLKIHNSIALLSGKARSPADTENRPVTSSTAGDEEAPDASPRWGQGSSLEKSAQGDAPPQQPTTSNQNFTLDMFARTSSHQIIEELERRLGVSALEGGAPAGVPKDRPHDLGTSEAFHSLGVPDH